MDQALEQLVTSLRKAIEDAEASTSPDEGAGRALHRALALLWSALDEIQALQQLNSRQETRGTPLRKMGADTDTTRDFEYADWDALNDSAGEIAAMLPEPQVSLRLVAERAP